MDEGLYTRTYSPATFLGTSLTQQIEKSATNPVQSNLYYLVGNGARTYYGDESFVSGFLIAQNVYSRGYVETIGLAGTESVNYVDEPVLPAGGYQTAISMQRTYVGRDTVSLKNGKTFNNACHYRGAQTSSNAKTTETTTADEWWAPGVGMVKTVADVGGLQIVTRELDSATVAGKRY
ncbi:hypothetical protein D7S89_17910 [Trinickia fusca]|uniref:Uncharacterized protein n=2 Tax=Trinickia fusca TaxID=2419777 RepID=A0A494XEH1_9BURK|nr:hypothetical protein D7S89_17910 [Trinickia fusca]